MLRRNCLVKHIIEGKRKRFEVTGRRGKRRKRLLDDLKETREYWNLEEGALDITLENLLWKGLWTCSKTDYGVVLKK